MPRPGKAWTTRDRYGDWVYLIWERWQHVLAHHPDMLPFFTAIQETVKQGRRKQDSLKPNKYFYRNWFDTLLPEYNCITVVVGVNTLTSDHYVITAYPDWQQPR